mmetsp:Transcript_13555/g.40882  ORF Transcript_13555/g.40882 Transcript_13555/m.40882 type:complete len:213 (-) Transcript_13555:2146-2784(-)
MILRGTPRAVRVLARVRVARCHLHCSTRSPNTPPQPSPRVGSASSVVASARSRRGSRRRRNWNGSNSASATKSSSSTAMRLFRRDAPPASAPSRVPPRHRSTHSQARSLPPPAPPLRVVLRPPSLRRPPSYLRQSVALLPNRAPRAARAVNQSVDPLLRFRREKARHPRTLPTPHLVLTPPNRSCFRSRLVVLRNESPPVVVVTSAGGSGAH